MEFVKMEGLGNDFVVFDGPLTPSADEVDAWCDRRRGIGADGVLVVTPDSDVRMEYWNADGSAAEMCGNGLRCVARYAVLRKLVARPDFVVTTAVGPRRVLVGGDVVRAELGPVDVADDQIELAGYRLTRVDAGNPHAVAFVDDVAAVSLEASGPLVETDPVFPERTNVEFASVVGRDLIDLRVWERGAGATLACGTGAAATVAVAEAQGRVDGRVTVRLPGGPLVVELLDGVAWIEGPAHIVFAGAL